MPLIFNVALATKNTARNYIWKDIGATTVSAVLDKRISQTANSKNDLEAIQNSIRNLFAFRKGQRILLPEFGNSIYSIVSNKITEGMLMTVDNAIRTMFNWEPRISILDVQLDPFPDENMIAIRMVYSVPSLSKSERFNIDGSIDLQTTVVTIG